MPKKLVCYFSGHFEVDVDKVKLLDTKTDEVKTAKQFLKERGNIDGLILQSFAKAYTESHDGEFQELDLEIEE